MKNLLFSDSEDFEKTFNFCIERDVGVELQLYWNPNKEESFPSLIERQLEKIRKIKPRGLHGPFAGLNCGALDPQLLEITRIRMDKGYEYATIFNATELIFHLGYIPKLTPLSYWKPRFVEFWKDYVENKSTDIHFHLENLLELTPDMVGECITALDRKNVDVCLDIGHAHFCSDASVVDWIKELGTMIGYVHLHDNDGTGDQHLSLGEGTIPMEEVCTALNDHSPDADWLIETKFEDLGKSYSWLSERGFI